MFGLKWWTGEGCITASELGFKSEATSITLLQSKCIDGISGFMLVCAMPVQT
jgi:hypothetical protein